jgi:hypothetical protein
MYAAAKDRTQLCGTTMRSRRTIALLLNAEDVMPWASESRYGMAHPTACGIRMVLEMITRKVRRRIVTNARRCTPE